MPSKLNYYIAGIGNCIHVITYAARHAVVSRITNQNVITDTTIKYIVTRTTIETVISSTTLDGIIETVTDAGEVATTAVVQIFHIDAQGITGP
ncbi:hypothetical protein D9M70_553240 [compost metagenome]